MAALICVNKATGGRAGGPKSVELDLSVDEPIQQFWDAGQNTRCDIVRGLLMRVRRAAVPCGDSDVNCRRLSDRATNLADQAALCSLDRRAFGYQLLGNLLGGNVVEFTDLA